MPRTRTVRILIIFLVLALLPVGVVSLVPSGSAHADDVPGTVHIEDRAYTPLVPARLLDTRSGQGAPAGAVGPGATIDLQVTGQGGVPASGVAAVVLNLTGTSPTLPTYVTAYPTGEARPTASNLNLVKGQTAPNLVIAKVGAGGKVSLYNAFGTVQLIADVLGWFAVTPDFAGLVPARLLDTRTGLGAPQAAVGPGKTIDLQVTGQGGVPASGVAAVVLNLTGTSPTAATYVTAYPTGETRPTASNLNLVKGQTAPNLVIAKVGAGGKVSLYNAFGTVQLIADVVGWVAIGSDYAALSPSRLLDTRSGLGAPQAPVGPGKTIDLQVTGRGDVPVDGVGAVVLNLTGTSPTAATYVTAYPTGEARPTASNLNLVKGQTAPNLVIAKVGAGGKVSLYNAFGTVQLIADVVGWISIGLTVDAEKPATTHVLDPATVVSVSSSMASVTVTGATPAIGDVVFVAPSATAGEGILGRVASTESAGGGATTVYTDPVRLGDAFPSGDVEGEADSRSLAPGAVGGAAKWMARQALRTDANGWTAVPSAEGPLDCSGHPVNVEESLEVESHVTLSLHWGLGHLKKFKVSVELGVEASLTVSAGFDLSCDVKLGPPVIEPIGWGFFEKAQTLLKLEIRAGVEEKATAKGSITLGAQYEQGHDIQWINSGDIEATGLRPTDGFVATDRLSIGVEDGIEFAAVIGPTLWGGLFVEAAVDTSQTPWWKLNAGVAIEESFDIDLWFVDFNYTLGAQDILTLELDHADGPWPGPTIDTSVIGAGEINTPYDEHLVLTGNAPLTTTVVSGALPPGIALDGDRLHGTPTTVGSYSAKIQVKDRDGYSTSDWLSLGINPPPPDQPQLPPVPDPAGTVWKVSGEPQYQDIKTHADGRTTVAHCDWLSDTRPRGSTFAATYSTTGSAAGTFTAPPAAAVDPCADNSWTIGPNGRVYVLADVGGSVRVLAYEANGSLDWTSPPIASCVVDGYYGLNYFYADSITVGANGDPYVLAPNCAAANNGVPDNTTFVRVQHTNGQLLSPVTFTDSVATPGEHSWAYQDGVVVVTDAVDPDTGRDAETVRYYHYDGSTKAVQLRSGERVDWNGQRLDWNGNIYGLASAPAPAGFGCTEGWLQSVVRVSPDGHTRRTPVEQCFGGSEEGNSPGVGVTAMADGGFLLSVNSFADTFVIHSFDSAGALRWDHAVNWGNAMPFEIADASGNVLVLDEGLSGGAVARFTLLNGGTGAQLWQWAGEDWIYSEAMSAGRLYVRTHYNGSDQIFAISGSFALDYPRSAVLG